MNIDNVRHQSCLGAIVCVAAALSLFSCAQTGLQKAKAPAPDLATIKIQAVSIGGRQNLGSGVIVAPNKIATNCHVTRKAKRAYLTQPDRLYPVKAQAALPNLDVCILETSQLALPPVELGGDEPVKVGDEITLSGYPFALGLRTMRAKVIALHPYADGNIIEINTGFNHGASGGGVFDKNGRLIGLMTFMGPENGSFHFYAIPATWLAECLDKDFVPLKPLSERSFWEKGEFKKMEDIP
jgi:serine protease Do